MNRTKSPARLLSQIPRDPWIWTQLPAAPGGSKPGADRYPGLFRDLARKFDLEVETGSDSFGQGIASFVEAWFSRDSREFRLEPLSKGDQHRTGLSVLAWRFGPYFVLSETSRSWGATSSARDLPDAGAVDSFRTATIRELSLEFAEALAGQGLVRLGKAELTTPLPERYANLTSNLRATSGPPTLFDALFFWND